MNNTRNIFLLTFSQALNFVLLFIFTPFLARSLSQNDYGTYSQVILSSEFINVFTSLSITQIVMMFLSKSEYKVENTIKTFLSIAFALSILALIINFGLSFYLPKFFKNDEIQKLMLVFSLNFLGQKLNLVLYQILIKIDKVKQVFIFSFFTSLLKLSAGVIAIKYYKSISLLLFVYSLEPIIISIVQLWVLKKENLLNGIIDKNTVRDFFKLAFPLYIVDILGTSYLYASGIFIGIFLNSTEYAIYRNGSFELPIIGTLHNSISIIYLKDFVKNIELKNYLEVASLKKKIITNTAVFIFPIATFFIICNKEFITLYMSSKYISSATIFAIYTTILFIRVQNYTDILIVLKKSKYILISFFIFMLSNISLNYILIQNFKIIGCAIATAASVYILAFLQLYFTSKFLKVSIFDYLDLFKLFTIGAVSIVTISIFKLITTYYLNSNLLIFILTSGLSFPIIYYLLIKKYIDIQTYRTWFEKIPMFGKIIYKLLN